MIRVEVPEEGMGRRGARAIDDTDGLILGVVRGGVQMDAMCIRDGMSPLFNAPQPCSIRVGFVLSLELRGIRGEPVFGVTRSDSLS
jgi:hypothetical protein